MNSQNKCEGKDVKERKKERVLGADEEIGYVRIPFRGKVGKKSAYDDVGSTSDVIVFSIARVKPASFVLVSNVMSRH